MRHAIRFAATDQEKIEAMRLIFALDPEAKFHDEHRDPERAVLDFPGYKSLVWEINHHHSIAFLGSVVQPSWAEVTAAELLAALRLQPAEPDPPPEPESWPGPYVQKEGVGTYATEIYRDGRLHIGCSTLTADSVRNLIVAYNRHHGLAFASGEPPARPAVASSEPAAGVVRVGGHWLKLRRDGLVVDVVLCDEAGTMLAGGFVVGFLSAIEGQLYCRRYSGVDQDHCLTDGKGRIQDLSG
jgi:hypothetical protein